MMFHRDTRVSDTCKFANFTWQKKIKVVNGIKGVNQLTLKLSSGPNVTSFLTSGGRLYGKTRKQERF